MEYDKALWNKISQWLRWANSQEINRNSPRYIAYMQSQAWRDLRAKVIARDKGTCQAIKKAKKKCGATKNLEVHHIYYANFGRENMADLMTVCHRCHLRIHEHSRYK